MTVRYAVRAQRKAASRSALIDAASTMFARHGYDETTLQEVADAAGLHVQTLYRHFPSKADLAAALEQSKLDAFREAFAERTSTTFAFWRDWIEFRLTAELADGGDAYRQVVGEIGASPTRSSLFLNMEREYEAVLAEGLTKDFQLPPTDPLPVLVACMLWGGHAHALREWAIGGGDLKAAALGMADRVAAAFGYLID